jgi:hypothetical protein
MCKQTDPDGIENIYPKVFDLSYCGKIFAAAALALDHYSSYIIRILAAANINGYAAYGGIIAVADTVLVYKVASRRHNGTIVIDAATLV